MFEDREMRLQLDVANKSVQFKYKIAIMLLHIHNFLLRAYHSMQSTLPGHQGSRGALHQQWEENTRRLGIDAMALCHSSSRELKEMSTYASIINS